MPGNGPTEVVEQCVWLGPAPVNQNGEAYEGSQHLPNLRAIGITHIVNCTPEVPFPTSVQLGLAEGVEVGQFRVAVEDIDSAAVELDCYFDTAVVFMREAVQGGGRVYVHCETGKSRSATVVLAYRVSCRGESLRDAYNATKARRDYIQPKPAFFNKLVAREPGWTGGEPSFSASEYALLYLLDQFSPLMWVDGITEESIRAAFAEAGEDAEAAHAKLTAVINANM